MTQYAKVPDLDDEHSFPATVLPERRRSKQSTLLVSTLGVVFVVFCLALTLPLGPSLPDIAQFKGISHQDNEIQTNWPGWDNIENIFAFGDSYSTIGFDSNKTQPSAQNPIGNRERFFSSWKSVKADWFTRPTWVELLTTTWNASIVKTYDFASPMCVVDYDNYQFDGYVPKEIFGDLLEGEIESFVTQLRYMFAPKYTKNHKPKGWDPDTTLFMAWFGINDHLVYYEENKAAVLASGAFPGSFFKAVTSSFQDLLEKLYQHGARNFLVPNLPPFFRWLPDMEQHPEKIAVFEDAVPRFNDHLKEIVNDLLSRHPSATVFYFDTWTLWDSILRNPKKYKQTESITITKEPCKAYALGTEEMNANDSKCAGPVSSYFWQNQGHVTFPVQNATAAMIWEDCWSEGGRKRFCF